MTLHSIRAAVDVLAALGKPLSRERIYALVQAGELPAIRIGGRLHLVNIESWLGEQARSQTEQRKRPARQFSVVSADRPRRFGSASR